MPRLTHCIHVRTSQSTSAPVQCGGSSLWKGKLDSVQPSEFDSIVKSKGRTITLKRPLRGNSKKTVERKVRCLPCGRCVVGYRASKRNGEGKQKTVKSRVKSKTKKSVTVIPTPPSPSVPETVPSVEE